ncbi:DUF3348 domain-containing protein [Dyella sp. A6]|uniref:DUF3348 domain-containing protein n=1 Tax=Dyella aluminiiresistens TaxID=3069105 RepID=UPI002E77C17A|nr:DUF3348 domain-containing protein [Dyella sp. A6]
MAQARPQAAVRGPTFIRLLARLARADVAPPGATLPDHLGQWLDWKHALALSSALDGRPDVADMAVDATDELHAECAQARATLTHAIQHDPQLAAGAHVPDEPDFGPFRQACLARQRAMQASIGRLRGRLRDALARGSVDAARLAEVDAVMEAALTPREHRLLEQVPALLEQRYERLRVAQQTPWLDGFRRDMQSVLLAELDVRFQPVNALLAALRTH